MNTWMSVSITIALLSLCFVGAYSQQKQCTTKPINVSFVLDLSALNNVTDMSVIRKAAIDLEYLLPNNSIYTLAVIDSNKAHIVGRFVKEDSSSKTFEHILYSFNDWTNNALNANFSAVQNMVKKSMKERKNPKYANIVFIIGNGGVKYDGLERRFRQKTYTVKVKDEASTWDEIATDPDHVIRLGELSTDTAKLKALLCNDSWLLCDTDQYMPFSVKLCVPCDDCKESLDYCSEVCKYYHPPLPTTTDPPSPAETTDEAAKVTIDNKQFVIIVAGFMAVAVLIVTLITCKCRKVRTFRQTLWHNVKERARGTHNQKPNVEIPLKVIIPESIAVAVDSASEETTPLKCDGPATNEDIVNVVEENHQVLDYTVDLGTKTRLQNTQPTTLQGE